MGERALLMSGDQVAFEPGLSDADRAQAIFPNQGLHTGARAFGASHARAIQYLEQAPVLVLGAMLGGPSVRRTNLLYIQHKLVPLCERGAPLKDVMRAFSLAPPLRRLKGFALFPSAGPTVAAICRLDPAMLGRVIPEKPGAQRNWLMAAVEWRGRLARRQRSPETHFAWAVEAMATAGVRARDVGDVADFASQPDVQFNEAWGWPRASEEAHLWAARLTVDKALAKSPLTRDTVIDLGAHPDVADHDGFTLLALRTPLALCDEGTAMRHCVATYISDVASGRSHIVSVQRGGKRIATLELNKTWQRVQCKGKANSAPGGDVLTAADHYAFDIRKALKAPPVPRGAAS